LSRHPQAEQKLHAEIDALPDQRLWSFEDARRLPYTRALIEESLRLYPPVWLLTRRALEADTLSGYALPPGTDVMFSLRDPAPPGPLAGAGGNSGRSASSPRIRASATSTFPRRPAPLHRREFSLYEMTVHFARMARHLRLLPADDTLMELEGDQPQDENPLRMRLLPCHG
jgi:hypothetical protein